MQLFMFIWGCSWSTETFSSTLTSENQNSGMGGIAMMTLSDTENNLHFILILQGLIKHKDNGERSNCKAHEKAPCYPSCRLKTTGILCWNFRCCFSLTLVSVRRASCGAHPSPARVPPAHPERNPSQYHLSRESRPTVTSNLCLTGASDALCLH